MSNPYHVGIPILILALWILFSVSDDTSCSTYITHIPQNILIDIEFMYTFVNSVSIHNKIVKERLGDFGKLFIQWKL